MERKIAEYKQQKKNQTSWLITTSLFGLFFVSSIFISSPILMILFFAIVIAFEVYCIVNLSKCTKRMDTLGMEIANELASSCNNQKELKEKLAKIGIPKNFALNYAIRVLGAKVNTKQQNETVTYTTPTNLTCPQCQTDRVHWIPYEKTPFGTTFYIWLVLSILGVSFSPIVTIIMFILWVLTIITRIIEEINAKKFNQYQCDMCGNKFEVPKK